VVDTRRVDAEDSAFDAERVQAKGGHLDLWQYANPVMIEAEKHCSKLVECVFQIG